MENQTADEIAAHYVAMGHSVDEITGGKHSEGETDAEWVLRNARNQEHLVLQKSQVHEDGSSWWDSEDMTAIDSAIDA